MTLNPNTTYFIHMDYNKVNRLPTWQLTNFDSNDSGMAAEWSVGNQHFRRNSDLNVAWTKVNYSFLTHLCHLKIFYSINSISYIF